MLDFTNSAIFKLKEVADERIDSSIEPLLIDGEKVVSSYKALRDFVVFTNKRIIAVNVQGITGSKKDFTSLPYSKIQAYSIETAGAAESFIGIGGDCELEVCFSGLGIARFEFKYDSNIMKICKVISEYVL